MKRQSVYANMTVSDLARLTRERKLDKSGVVTLSDWADLLEADDKTRAEAVQQAEAPKETDSTPKKGKE